MLNCTHAPQQNEINNWFLSNRNTVSMKSETLAKILSISSSPVNGQHVFYEKQTLRSNETHSRHLGGMKIIRRWTDKPIAVTGQWLRGMVSSRRYSLKVRQKSGNRYFKFAFRGINYRKLFARELSYHHWKGGGTRMKTFHFQSYWTLFVDVVTLKKVVRRHVRLWP